MKPADEPQKTNNDRLRDLVEASGLSQAAALAIFNIGLGVAAYSINTFKAFLARQGSAKFRPLRDDLLAHAEKNFSKHLGIKESTKNSALSTTKKGTSTL